MCNKYSFPTEDIFYKTPTLAFLEIPIKLEVHTFLVMFFFFCTEEPSTHPQEFMNPSVCCLWELVFKGQYGDFFS